MPDWKAAGSVETLDVASLGKRTLLVKVTADSKSDDIGAAIRATDWGKPECHAAVVVIGGTAQPDAQADGAIQRALARVIPAAAASSAWVFDAATSRVMALIGSCAADRLNAPPVIGFSPESGIRYPGGIDPLAESVPLNLDHSATVLYPGSEWHSAPRLPFDVAKAVCQASRATALIVNGDANTRKQAVIAVRQQLQIVVAEGTGGLADQVASLLKEKPDLATVDPELAEIAIYSDITVMPLNGDIEIWAQVFDGPPDDSQAILTVWDQCRRFNDAATAHQRRFRRLQWAVLLLGVLVTLLAILFPGEARTTDGTEGQSKGPNYLVISLPIIISILYSFIARFREGSLWVTLRSGAEALYSELFRFRTRTGPYRDQQPGALRATRLSEQVGKIVQSVALADGNVAGVPDKGGPKQEDVKRLSADEYIAHRLFDQISYYEKSAKKLQRKTKFFHALIYIAGGAGTFLAAIGFNVWVALSTAIATAFAANMEREQQENLAKQYRLALASMTNIHTWWTSLSPWQKQQQVYVDKLVNDVETIATAEVATWVKLLQAAVDKAQQKPEEPKKEEARSDAARAASAGGVAGAGEPPSDEQPAREDTVDNPDAEPQPTPDGAVDNPDAEPETNGQPGPGGPVDNPDK